MAASIFGNLPRSGGLAPQGSGASDADPHTDDVAEGRRAGSTPMWRSGTSWAAWAVFLAVAYVVYRVGVR